MTDMITAGPGPEAIVAAGLVHDVLSGGTPLDRDTAATALRLRLGTSAVWRPAGLAPAGSGTAAHGSELPAWRPPRELTEDAAAVLALAWHDVVPAGESGFLRVQVDGPSAADRLRDIGRVGPIELVPSMPSRGSLTKPLTWRWPLHVGVMSAAAGDGWLGELRGSHHHGVVFDADPLTVPGPYEIVIVDAADLDALAPEMVEVVERTSCVVAVGGDPAIDLLDRVERAVSPVIAIGVTAPPMAWWQPFFDSLAHDLPIDVAVEIVHRWTDVDMRLAGPPAGMDVTAPGRWLAVVAPRHADLAPLLDELAGWDWSMEGGGATNTSDAVRRARGNGSDPVVEVPPSPGRQLGRPQAVGDRDEAMAAAPPGDEPSATEEPSAGPPPGAPPPERFVQAVVLHDGVERLTFVADAPTVLRVWIGPRRGEPGAVADHGVRELSESVTLRVDLLIGTEAVASGDLTLPRGATVRSSDCELALPPLPAGFFAGELAFTLDGRIYELVQVLGQVTAAGAGDGAMPLELRTQVHRRDLIDLAGRSRSSAALDVTTVDGQTVVREFGPRAAGVFDLTGSKPLVRFLTRELFATETALVRKHQAAGTAAEPDAVAADADWNELLRKLATHGWLLHRDLRTQGFDDPGDRIEVVNRLPDEYLPIEFVYDRGAPAATAIVDPACLLALREGRDDCGTCHPFDELTDAERDANPRICPFGFWSLRKIIERHDPEPSGRLSSAGPTSTHRRLRRFDAVLGGWSARIRDEDVAALREGLALGGRRADFATDWDDWRRRLGDEPSILLALPHHDEADGVGTLEIGGDELGLQRALDLYVSTPAGAPSPILVLLGCETDGVGELGHPSFARAFNSHASVVIGTLSKILGRHAVPFSQALVDALVAGQDAGHDIGTVMRDVRRRMFADGFLMALGVIALGDADWQLDSTEVA